MWFKLKQAAEYSGVSKNTVREWIDKGLKSSRVGSIVLIQDEMIDRFLQEHVQGENKLDIKVKKIMKKLG